MFGVGQLIGSPLVGLVNDKFGGGQSVARTLLFVHFASYLVIIVFNEIHVFGILAFVVTFLCGVSNAALQTQVNIVCGFEFKTNVEPYAIYRLFSSLTISFALVGESYITSKTGYRYFFIGCMIVTMLS